MSASGKLRLGVNVDHVATLRNARGGLRPNPIRAALLAVEAGADGITAHLREDRRHIRDADMRALKDAIGVPLNFEMAATPEMEAIALEVMPHAVCLVPEKREERTTEGGLDVAGGAGHLRPMIRRLVDAGIRVSLFIEADETPLRLAAEFGAPVVELHTGTWCEAVEAGDSARAEAEFARLRAGAELGASLGLEIHAGHGLDYATAQRISTLLQLRELNIGHFLVGEAVFIGFAEAIRRMRTSMDAGRAEALGA